MKFHRSSFIFATLASSSSFKALAAPTDRNQQHDVAARQIPDAPGVVPPAAPPVPGVVSSSLSAISGGMQPPSIPSVPGTGSTSGGNPSTPRRDQAVHARQLDGVVTTLESLLASLGLGSLLNPVLDIVGGLLGVQKAAAASLPLNASQIDQVRAAATKLANQHGLPLPGQSNNETQSSNSSQNSSDDPPVSGLPVLGDALGGANHAAFSLGQQNDVVPTDNSTTVNNSTTPVNGTDTTASLDAAGLAAFAELAAANPIAESEGLVAVPFPIAVPVDVPIPSGGSPLSPPLPGAPPNTPNPPQNATSNSTAPASATSPPGGLPVSLPVPTSNLPVPHAGAPDLPSGTPPLPLVPTGSLPVAAPALPSGGPALPSVPAPGGASP